MRHSLSEVCPALTASTTMRMAWMTTEGLSIMMLCPECVSVGQTRRQVQRSFDQSSSGLTAGASTEGLSLVVAGGGNDGVSSDTDLMSELSDRYL